jgi:hypothetical protein
MVASSVRSALLASLLFVVFPCWVDGHPNHDAVAEVDWNPESKSLEVAMRVTPHELERALSDNEGRAVDLDEEKSLPVLKAYIEANVRLLNAEGKPVKLSWVGAEIKVRSAWVYFEFPIGKPTPIGCKISNTIFFERHEDQKNTVALKLKSGEPRTFLRFSKKEPRVEIKDTRPGGDAE